MVNLAGGLARAHHNFGTPILISATVESTDFKFGAQLGFGK